MADGKSGENSRVGESDQRIDLLRARYGGKPATKLERVNFIADLMASNQFVTGQTIRELAVAWDMPEPTVRTDSAEASHTFAIAPEEREARKARWYAKLEHAQSEALSARRFEAHATYMKLEGEQLGVFEPAKIDLNVTGDDHALAGRVAALLAGGEEGETSEEAKPSGSSTH